MISHVSCCFWLNTNWKIQLSPYIWGRGPPPKKFNNFVHALLLAKQKHKIFPSYIRTFDAIEQQFWVLYLNTRLIFLEHMVVVTSVFHIVGLKIEAKIIFDMSTELSCVSSKWSVMFQVASDKIQIEKSNLDKIWGRGPPEKKFSDFFRPFYWLNSSIKSSPHIHERLML